MDMNLNKSPHLKFAHSNLVLLKKYLVYDY